MIFLILILVQMGLHDELDFEFDPEQNQLFKVDQQCLTMGVQHSCNTITGQLLTLA